MKKKQIDIEYTQSLNGSHRLNCVVAVHTRAASDEPCESEYRMKWKLLSAGL